MTKNDKKLIKSYQFLAQYLLYSIKHINNKKDVLNELGSQQQVYNNKAEELLGKQVLIFCLQKVKIKSLQMKNKDLRVNTISFEYLVKHLKLDKIINSLGKPLEGK